MYGEVQKPCRRPKNKVVILLSDCHKPEIISCHCSRIFCFVLSQFLRAVLLMLFSFIWFCGDRQQSIFSCFVVSYT